MKKLTMMKIAAELAAGLVFLIAWMMFSTQNAYATGGSHECQGGHNCNDGGAGPVTVEQDQGQMQGQDQEQEQSMEQGQEQAATATSDSMSTSGSTSTNEGNNTEINSHTENNSSNVVLVPNNNTEKCLRVWGIAWGKDGQSGALGIPWRSAKCDFEQAADDAFAAGERELGWFWKCKNKNLYREFKGKGESKESASRDCLDEMVGGVTAIKTINTLRETLTTVNTEREIERNKYKESRERLTQACNESKDRILEACTRK